MRIVQKGKRIRGGTMNPTTELDRFIHRVQVRSRVTVDGKIIRMEPVQEKIKFDVTPSKDRYDNCCMVVYAGHPMMTCRATM